MITHNIPRTPGQLSRMMRSTVNPIAKIGKENALRKVASFSLIASKSLVNRSIAFSNFDDLMLYDERLDILL